MGMIGTVEQIIDGGSCVRAVRVRLPLHGSSQGKCLLVETLERIGQGSFGTVYRARCDEHPKLALKIATGKVARLKQELEVLSKVCTKGKLLLPRLFFGAINRTGDLIAVGMELCFPHTLHDFLLAKALTSEADKLFLAHQVVQAVADVHEQQCIHRDVKLQNFVFDLDGNLKLIDFGLATATWNPPAGDVVAGTIAFMAPEMAHNALHRDQRVSVGAAADVWSVGMVLFAIFAQRNPYAAVSGPRPPFEANGDNTCGGTASQTNEAANSRLTKQIPKENVELLRQVAAAKWSWPSDCDIPKRLRGLVEFVLVADPQGRPDINAVLGRPEWGDRRRGTPVVVTTFLGVEDDFLISHDESHLLRAVEERSNSVNASATDSRVRGSSDEEAETAQRPSLKFVEGGELSVGGVPTHRVYDVRPDPKVKKPIREITSVIAAETEKSSRRCKSSSARAASDPVSRANSRTGSRSRTVTPVPCTTAFAEGWGLPTGNSAASLVLLEAEAKGEQNSEARSRVKAAKGSRSLARSNDKTGGEDCVGNPGRHDGGGCGAGERCGKLGSVGRAAQRGLSPVLGVRAAKRARGRSCNTVEARPHDSMPSKRKRCDSKGGVVRVSEVIAAEDAVRLSRESLLLEEHKCLVTRLSSAVLELFDREHMVWLEKEQRRTASHPHKFKEMTRANRKYKLGFVCDLCCFEFEPVGKDMHFYHCECGSDLCPQCHTKYTRKRTCDACGRIFDNLTALYSHRSGCTGRLESSPRTKVERRRCGSRPSDGNRTKTPRKSAEGPSRKLAVAGHRTANRRVSLSATSSKKVNEPVEIMGIAARRRAERISMSATQVVPPPPRFEGTPRDIGGEWNPMERLSVAVFDLQPTAEEREMLLNGDWIRYYHFYPMEEGEDSIAVTYRIQPGRTGVTFFSHEYSVHSAVLATLDPLMCVVDSVNIEEDNDVVRILTLAQALHEEKRVYDILHAVNVYDTNMLKQRRSPGVLSVYCPPQTAFQCNSDPFVFVRWYRFHMENSMSGFMLSNGAIQVFVGGEYELRWMDDNRKFIVRNNGVCELLDEATFPLLEELNRLLYEGV